MVLRRTITCPMCDMTSRHPVDVEQQYCSNCHNYHSVLIAIMKSITPKKEADKK